MSFASQAENRRKENAALLKKKRFFDFHQNIIQRFYAKGGKKKARHDKFDEKQRQLFRRELELEHKHESGRKFFLLTNSFVITLVVLSLIVYIFKTYVF